MASLVAHGLTKIINVPTMKDHSASGVTGCLKNLGYGTFNNVARSHRAPYSFTDPLIGTMCSVEPLRSKAVLHIMDGMRQVWHGGPLTQVQDFIYPAGTLYIGTDPAPIESTNRWTGGCRRFFSKTCSVANPFGRFNPVCICARQWTAVCADSRRHALRD